MGILGGIPLKSWDSFPKLIPARNLLSLNSRNRNSCRNSLRNVFDVFDASSKCLFSQVSGALKSLWRLKSTWQHPEGHTRPHKESKPGLWQRAQMWTCQFKGQRSEAFTSAVALMELPNDLFSVEASSCAKAEAINRKWWTQCGACNTNHIAVLHSWTCNGQD